MLFSEGHYFLLQRTHTTFSAFCMEEERIQMCEPPFSQHHPFRLLPQRNCLVFIPNSSALLARCLIYYGASRQGPLWGRMIKQEFGEQVDSWDCRWKQACKEGSSSK